MFDIYVFINVSMLFVAYLGEFRLGTKGDRFVDHRRWVNGSLSLKISRSSCLPCEMRPGCDALFYRINQLDVRG